MIRPEIVKKLGCPAYGLSISWNISKNSIPAESVHEVHRCFRREFWPFPKTPAVKDTILAGKLRQKANVCYRKQSDSVLQMYNESICHAAEGSEELAMGYANRSAVYFNRKLYYHCLHNIELAKASGYPADKMEKLLEREKKCLMQIEQLHPEPEEAPLIKDSVSSLRVADIPGCGQGLVAENNFTVGDVILREHPVLIIPEPEAVYTRCANCGDENELDLLPCKHCILSMYCSDKCRSEAYDRFHRYECEIMHDMTHLFKGPKHMRTFLLMLRLFWLTITNFMQNPHDFIGKYKENLSLYKNPLNISHDELHLHVLSKPLTILAKDLAGKGVCQFLTVLIYNIAVMESSAIEEHFRETHHTLILDILYRLIVQASQVSDQSRAGLTCYYPLLQMVNHSCAPNTERFCAKGKGFQSYLLTKRPILTDEQITMCYLPQSSSEVMEKKDRLIELRKEFQFHCRCLACALDYPLLSTIEENRELDSELQAICNEIENNAEKLSALKEFLQRHDKHYPQRELTRAWAMYKEKIIGEL
ncbi:uncharacterized protein LOC128734435 [Sabethes cyaneus]|uniref:uncharacterized protein LOC128734435 n=1 Tax=Sabethes cyaneus TaxID=53552 RepID=UPI00237E178E|nr:uncharacterized protein LOC128734435 [Sabethes cyaneus]